MKKISLFLFLACFVWADIFAVLETPSTQGSEFYFSFIMARPNRAKTLTLTVTSPVAGVIKFTNAGAGGTSAGSYNFGAGVTRIDLASVTAAGNDNNTYDQGVVSGTFKNCYTNRANQVMQQGYMVQAFLPDGTTPVKVSLYAGLDGSKSSDAANIYPIEALGNEYYVISRCGNSTSGGDKNFSSVALVMATEDNTVVDIYPSCIIDDQASSADIHGKIRKTLNRGETYQLRALSADNAKPGENDLTGTRFVVASDVAGNRCKKIAVFAGTQHGSGVNNPYDNGDYEYDQMFPVHLWGTEYITGSTTVNSNRSGGDVIRVVASQPCTEVYINGEYKKTLNQGDFYEHRDLQDKGSYVKASKPVEVGLFTTGERRGSDADGGPALIVLAPLQQYLRDITFTRYNAGGISGHSLMITALTSIREDTYLNGTQLNTTNGYYWTEIESYPEYSQLVIDISDIQYTLTNTAPEDIKGGFNAIVYGSAGNDTGYGYSVGASAVVNKTDFYAGGDPDLNAAKGGCLAKDTEFEAYLPFVYGSIKWQFGDGAEETIQYPNVKVTHKYDLTEQELINGKNIDVTMIVYKDATGCFDTSASDTIIGHYIVKPAEQTVANVEKCKNDTLQCPRSASEFGTGETITYKWFNAAGTEVGNQPFLQITDAHGADAKYWVRSRDNACHFYIDTFYVHVREIGTSFEAKNPFCEGDEIKSKNAGSTYAEYTKTNPISYKWYNKNNPTVEVAATEAFKPSNGKGESATYFVKSENGCLYVDTFAISIPAKIEVSLASDKLKVCETASQVTLTASATPAASVLSTEWNGQATTETAFIETPITTTTYTYTAKGSCETVDKSVTVEVNPAFTAELEAESNDFIGLNVLPVSGGTVTFKVNIDIPGNYIYEWKPKTVSTTASYTQNVVEDVSYWVEVFDADRLCSSTTNQVAIVLGEVTMPTVFVPGIDREFGATAWNSTVPLNDTFTYGYSLGIYNRYGGQIFYVNNPAGELPEGWDGYYKSKIADAGVYFYVIEYKVADGSAKALKGSIEIVKP